jgi:mannose-6-phosphate isomerase-like protein (cupin superfamily)
MPESHRWLTQLRGEPYLSFEIGWEDSMRFASSVRLVAMGLCCFVAAGAACGQQADHYTPEALQELAKPLQEKAASAAGSASETLQKYGVDYTMLSFRSKDGVAELHEKFADIFVVIDGSATLLSGGELANPTPAGAGDTHGTSILHATTTTLSKGDIVHIPANTPHQLLIPKNGTLTYFVVKVKERD